MSLFSTIETVCPHCDVAAEFEMVFSVNADRRPELRAEILGRTFQQLECPTCHQLFRMEPQFTYLHIAGKQFLTVWPSGDLAHWADKEAESQRMFDKFWGPNSGPVTADIGRELVHRVAFGWEATHEKFVAADAGIDDVTLELVKLAVIRSQGDSFSVGETALRLVGVDDQANMILGLFEGANEHVDEQFTVPRALLDEIDADEEWDALRERLQEGPFVDMLRLVTEPVPA
jgi:hypothetical protein